MDCMQFVIIGFLKRKIFLNETFPVILWKEQNNCSHYINFYLYIDLFLSPLLFNSHQKNSWFVVYSTKLNKFLSLFHQKKKKKPWGSNQEIMTRLFTMEERLLDVSFFFFLLYVKLFVFMFFFFSVFGISFDI